MMRNTRSRQARERRNMSEERLKLAILSTLTIIQIGVKDTLERNSTSPSSLKRSKNGEWSAKTAYGDWFPRRTTREMTQHAVHMVQRNVTPAVTRMGRTSTWLSTRSRCLHRDHINAFAIVGGDSDFIAW